MREITIRHNTKFNETIEVKRIYIHPDYVFPELYNDVAVLELGRRIPYDYEKVGVVVTDNHFYDGLF